MSAKPKILVTSAAGKTGLPTTLQLLEKGYPVRAFVRKADHRSARLETAGAEIFVGDQYSIVDMRNAMTGIKRAYQCAPMAPNGLHFNVIFTAAAFEAKLEHVVTLSQWLASPDHPSLFTREVYLGDIIIKMRPEMSVTTINVGWFADNYLMVLEMAAQLGMLTMPMGDGNEKKNAPPSNEDIASVVVGALIDPATHAGKTYRPTGPELLSPNEIAATIGRVLGRRVKYQNISDKMFLKALKAIPPLNYSDAAATQIRIYTDEYQRGTFAIGAPTDAVKRVGGREPESFEALIRRVVSERPEVNPSFKGKLKAIADFMKILITTAPKPDETEKNLDHVLLAAPVLCQDSAEWREHHVPVSPETNARKVA
jgi:NAD(P)H dehydrogenase (quinone)